MEADGAHDSIAAAFSPDGDVLYVTTTDNILLAVDSDGLSSSYAEKYNGGSDLCDIAVSPDGLSVGWGSCCFLGADNIPASFLKHVR